MSLARVLDSQVSNDLPRLSGHNQTLMVTSKWKNGKLELGIALKERGAVDFGEGGATDTCFADKGMRVM